MIDDPTYQSWLDEAHLTCARKWVLIIGEDSLRSSSDSVKDQVNSITDLDRLERMAQAAEKAASWREILETGKQANTTVETLSRIADALGVEFYCGIRKPTACAQPALAR
jgi:hypothetical protein